MAIIEPFIRWAGGKTWLVKSLDQIIGNLQYRRYYEPFIGGGAIFFAMDHRHNCYLSDLNKELIDTYIAVRDMPEAVISRFIGYNNTSDDYYRIRSLNPDDQVEKAARFIYLNQTSYNGLYRVNRQGQYNVPYGRREKWTYDINKIITASQKLQKVKLQCFDFEGYKYRIKENDLVFLDPPYTVSHNNNGFIKYNQNLFSINDQYRLSRYIDFIKRKGAYYILTNAAHPVIREIFQRDGDRILELDRQSLIGGKEAARTKVSEYVFTNIPEEVSKDE
ncbi:DNA adenine methylase [Paenibacillus pectinilyticus]|uniref:site-specific DNA-methyltransferase (adenine-specific) n=1 Tax=Paenibacillus pectinilyticus TaxID=512399 RepID=A0A1C1A8I5_9BACL|nr:Dam family site-specific DNA-(adenine-N6)-methyltransferase [Paenibacillus pectinilyticus]OCT16859.1 DNA adenine methylase [Paenibacillus pectinilyticus]